jgi:hypothetical protein
MVPAIPFCRFELQQVVASGNTVELLVVPTGSLSLRVLLTAAGDSWMMPLCFQRQTASRPTLDLGEQLLMSKRGGISFVKEGGISKKGLVAHVRTLCSDQSVGCCTQHHREDFVALSSQWEGMVVEAERDAERATAATLLKECDSTDSGHALD